MPFPNPVLRDHLAPTPESVGICSDKLEAVFARAEKEVREGLLPSCQIAVARDGRIAGARSFGRVEFQRRPAPVDDATLYCIFSCTKAFTSAALWMLLESGDLHLDEKVADIVPEFATNGKDAVTVEQLFTHTAGFPLAPFDPEEFLDHERRMARLSQWRLTFEPGTRFVYHPWSSMVVLAEILERRTGLQYNDFVKLRITEPLGLHDFYLTLPDAKQLDLADTTHVGTALTPADYERMGFPVPPPSAVTEEAIQAFNESRVRRAGIPGGGGITTATSLALFYQGLLGHNGGDRIWKPETIEMAREIRTGELTDPIFDKAANRGLGLIIAGGPDRNYRGFGHTNSEKAFGHNGAGGQLAWADPETGISLGYCTNAHDRDDIRQARRGIGISSRAAACLAEA